MEQTPKHRLADILLGDDGPLERWVREQRDAGVSWRRLVIDLSNRTNGEVDLTYETLRQWFPDLIKAAS